MLIGFVVNKNGNKQNRVEKRLIACTYPSIPGRAKQYPIKSLRMVFQAEFLKYA